MALNNFTYPIYVIPSQKGLPKRKVSAFNSYLTQIVSQRFKTELKFIAKTP